MGRGRWKLDQGTRARSQNLPKAERSQSSERENSGVTHELDRGGRTWVKAKLFFKDPTDSLKTQEITEVYL